MRDDIDVRLIDYHEHSRAFGHVSRVKESWEGVTTLNVPNGRWDCTDGKEHPDNGIPFPIGDEV